MSNKWRVLHTAARNGCLEIVQSLLKKGADVHIKTADGDTPLLMAAEGKHKDIVQLLINAGADINIYNRKKWTVLHCASKNGWLDIVQYLLKKGADIDTKNDCGDTPLLLAAYHKHKEIVKLLIDAGADINCPGSDIHTKTDDGWAPMLLAADNEQKDIIELLSKAEADISGSGGNNHCTLLHCASKNGWLDVVHSLLKKGADIHTKTGDGWSPLFLAAHNSHKDIVELLINAKADIHCSGCWDDYTVLHYASQYGWLDIVQSLLSKGADINTKNVEGSTPLVLAAEGDWKELVEFLISAGADIHCSGGSFEWTVYNYASKNGWLEIIKSLLKKGVDIHAKTDDGTSPLLLAGYYGHKDIVEFLINAGVDINCTSGWNNCTLLHYASKSGWLKILQCLLKKGVNIEAKSNTGKTSLQIACIHNRMDIVVNLINAGAEVNSKCYYGNAPLSNHIKHTPNTKLVSLLIENGAYLKPIDYKKILRNFVLKKCILQNIELCSQAVINEFNHKDLPEMYKLFVSCNLPPIEKMRIGNKSQITYEVLQSVKKEQQVKGRCNVLKVRPIVLKMLCVKSLLGYGKALRLKRPAEFDNDNQTIHLSKAIRLFAEF